MILLQPGFTSAGGRLETVTVVMFAMLGPITTATPCSPSLKCERGYLTTNAGAPLTKPTSTTSGSAVAELRRRSGLSWEQLAGLLRVSRRALHFWATDKQMRPANELRLHRLVAAIRRIDRGHPSRNRTLLFSPLEGGLMPYDLLCDGKYEEGVEQLSDGRASPRPEPEPLSTAERIRRRPPAPADLLGAMQDSIRFKSGRVVRTKPIRRTRRD